MDGIKAFNELPSSVAEEELYRCLANRRWATRLVEGRPYRDLADLLAAADIATGALTDDDWRHAIAAHPRIGERGGDAPEASAREQSRALQAPAATREALAVENRHYEERFGHVFVIAASGRSAKEILAELRRRMTNSPERELEEAERELRRIVELRLGEMLLP